MIFIHYWQALTKRLIIKKALSHLLLGVIATGFSLPEQTAIPVFFAENVNIITIESLVQVQENHHINKVHSHPAIISCFYQVKNIIPLYFFIALSDVIRLSSENGIRAGPISSN